MSEIVINAPGKVYDGLTINPMSSSSCGEEKCRWFAISSDRMSAACFGFNRTKYELERVGGLVQRAQWIRCKACKAAEKDGRK